MINKTVLVTGGNGHLGNTLAKALCNEGYDVHVTVRDANEIKQSHIFDGYNIKLFSADIRDAKALKKAMAGVSGVFQVAALYNYDDQSIGENIVDNNTEGGLTVLQVAKECGVKRVVMTSSIVAVGFGGTDNAPMTEENWSDPSDPYCLSKKESEKVAWKFADENGLDLVTICPSLILGPNFYKHTPTTMNVSAMLSNQIPFRLPMQTSVVDVRDVARAHILAYETANASGRYLVSGTYIVDFCEALKEVYGDLEIPERILSIEETRQFAQKSKILPLEMIDQSFIYSDERIKSELGWESRPIQETLADTVEWLQKYSM